MYTSDSSFNETSVAPIWSSSDGHVDTVKHRTFNVPRWYCIQRHDKGIHLNFTKKYQLVYNIGTGSWISGRTQTCRSLINRLEEKATLLRSTHFIQQPTAYLILLWCLYKPLLILKPVVFGLHLNKRTLSPTSLPTHFYLATVPCTQHQNQRIGSPLRHTTAPLNESELWHFPRTNCDTGTQASKRRSWHCAQHRKNNPPNPTRKLPPKKSQPSSRKERTVTHFIRMHN